eukprot:COSAG04_NODE_5967_length_1446_cov_2.177431_1_plen_276_part_10
MKAERPSPLVAGVGAWLLILSAAVWDTRRACPLDEDPRRELLVPAGAELLLPQEAALQEEQAAGKQREMTMAELRKNITVTVRSEMMAELKARDEQTRKHMDQTADRVGFVPAAEHTELAARVAQLERTNAELMKNCGATGEAVLKSQKSAEGFAARLVTVEGMLAEEGEARRQMQGSEPEPEPVQGEYVLQIKRNVSKLCRPGCGCTGGMDTAGNFDMSRCCDPGWNACYPQECAGANCLHGDGKGRRRRAQAAARRCKPADLAARAAEVTAECC